MSRKIHRRWKAVKDVNVLGEQIIKHIPIPIDKCPGCARKTPRCLGCNQLFTMSTVLDPDFERVFCSQPCADYHLNERPLGPRHKKRKFRHEQPPRRRSTAHG